VAGIDECSYCDVAVGPSAACKTAAKQTKPNKLNSTDHHELLAAADKLHK